MLALAALLAMALALALAVALGAVLAPLLGIWVALPALVFALAGSVAMPLGLWLGAREAVLEACAEGELPGLEAVGAALLVGMLALGETDGSGSLPASLLGELQAVRLPASNRMPHEGALRNNSAVAEAPAPGGRVESKAAPGAQAKQRSMCGS